MSAYLLYNGLYFIIVTLNQCMYLNIIPFANSTSLSRMLKMEIRFVYSVLILYVTVNYNSFDDYAL